MSSSDQKSWRGLIAGVAAAAVIVCGAAVWLYWPSQKGVEDPLAALKEGGKLTVGVRNDAEPFSYLDESGKILGFEPDLARAIASQLGLELVLVPVDPDGAMGFVEKGVVDIAILPIDEIESQTVRFIDPGYFASGLSAVGRDGGPVSSWDDLNGRTACGVGVEAEKPAAVEELGGRFIGFSDIGTALEALAAERCDVVVDDETALLAVLSGSDERGFSRPLETIDTLPWRMAVRRSDQELAEYVRLSIVDWHLNGFLVDKTAAWALPDNPYLEEMGTYLDEGGQLGN